MLSFNAPFPKYGQILHRNGVASSSPPDLKKITDYRVSDGIVQAVYYGAIAAFIGKNFTNLNPTYAAAYGVLRGILDQPCGIFMFKTLIGEASKQKDTPSAMVYISILLESLAAMVVIGIACKTAETLHGGLSSLSKGRITPMTHVLSLNNTLLFEASFIVSGVGLLILKTQIEPSD